MSDRLPSAKSNGVDFLAEIDEWQRKINAMPPTPHAIVAHHAVPYGRAFRQWDTAGRLLVWANRGEIEDMPRSSVEPNPFAAAPTAAFGIRVVKS